jgi:hypothetical protein
MRFYSGPRLGKPYHVWVWHNVLKAWNITEPHFGHAFSGEKKKKKDNKSFLDTLKIELERVMKFKLRL